MNGLLNKKVMDKFQKLDADESIKNFLKDILFFEIENSDIRNPKYKEEYIKMMRKYVETYKEDENIEDWIDWI